MFGIRALRRRVDSLEQQVNCLRGQHVWEINERDVRDHDVKTLFRRCKHCGDFAGMFEKKKESV